MSKPRILLVEDDELLLKMYNAKFIMEGFETETAKNGQEALDILRTFKPTLVILDVMMPVMDGIETLKRIKADPNLKDLPVVMLTNLSAVEKVEEVGKLGALGYLVKSSSTPNEVVEKVNKIIQNSNLMGDQTPK